MNHAMTDDALDAWQKHIATLSTRNSRSKAAFKRCIIEMTKEYCGEKCYENQLEYMKRTKKPEEIDIRNFLKRLDFMNNSLPKLKDGGTSLSKADLNELCITKDISVSMALDYLKQGGDQLTDMDDIKTLLTRLERADKLSKKINASKEKFRTKKHDKEKYADDKNKTQTKKRKDLDTDDKDKDKDKDIKISAKCRLPNHDHP